MSYSLLQIKWLFPKDLFYNVKEAVLPKTGEMFDSPSLHDTTGFVSLTQFPYCDNIIVVLIYEGG
jgi:hypothetical protein